MPRPIGWRWTTSRPCCGARNRRWGSPMGCAPSSSRRRQGALRPPDARWPSAAALDPGVGRVVADDPLPYRPRHHIEIIEIVAVRRADGMIAARHEYDIAVFHAYGLIDTPVVRVDALESKALRRVEPMVVDLLELRLGGRSIGVMLVRRIARPVSAGSDHLDDENPLGRLCLRQHVAHQAPVGALTPDLLRHPIAGDGAGLAQGRGRCAAQSDLGVAAGLYADVRVGRCIYRAGRRVLEHGFAASEIPEGDFTHLYVSDARQDDYTHLFPGRCQGHPLARSQPADLEADILPACALRRDRENPAVRIRRGGPHSQAHRPSPERRAAGLSKRRTVSRPIRLYTRGSARAGSCSASTTTQPL